MDCTEFSAQVEGGAAGVGPGQSRDRHCAPQETSDKSVIELQQYAKKNKPNLHILSKLQEEMKRLAEERVSTGRGPFNPLPPRQWEGAKLHCTVAAVGRKLSPRNLSLASDTLAVSRHLKSPNPFTFDLLVLELQHL